MVVVCFASDNFYLESLTAQHVKASHKDAARVIIQMYRDNSKLSDSLRIVQLQSQAADYLGLLQSVRRHEVAGCRIDEFPFPFVSGNVA